MWRLDPAAGDGLSSADESLEDESLEDESLEDESLEDKSLGEESLPPSCGGSKKTRKLLS